MSGRPSCTQVTTMSVGGHGIRHSPSTETTKAFDCDEGEAKAAFPSVQSRPGPRPLSPWFPFPSDAGQGLGLMSTLLSFSYHAFLEGASEPTLSADSMSNSFKVWHVMSRFIRTVASGHGLTLDADVDLPG